MNVPPLALPANAPPKRPRLRYRWSDTPSGIILDVPYNGKMTKWSVAPGRMIDPAFADGTTVYVEGGDIQEGNLLCAERTLEYRGGHVAILDKVSPTCSAVMLACVNKYCDGTPVFALIIHNPSRARRHVHIDHAQEEKPKRCECGAGSVGLTHASYCPLRGS